MMSLTRSALSRVLCSRCWRCSRTLRYPSRAKITTMAPSKSMFSLALRVSVRRVHRLRFGSVSCMLHDRRNVRQRGLVFHCWLRQELFLGEDRQVLYRHAEEGEAGCDDHAGDRQLRLFGEVTYSGGRTWRS